MSLEGRQSWRGYLQNAQTFLVVVLDTRPLHTELLKIACLHHPKPIREIDYGHNYIRNSFFWRGVLALWLRVSHHKRTMNAEVCFDLTRKLTS